MASAAGFLFNYRDERVRGGARALLAFFKFVCFDADDTRSSLSLLLLLLLLLRVYIKETSLLAACRLEKSASV